MVRRKKKNSYELSLEEAKKWKQITIFDAIAAIESRGGDLANVEKNKDEVVNNDNL